MVKPKRRRSRAIAIVNRRRIIAEVAKGRLIREIAADYGIKKPNISKHLAKDPAYRKAREKAAALRLERARLALRAAGMQSKSRRKELKAYNFAMWFCQTHFPERWPAPPFIPRIRRGFPNARSISNVTTT